MLCPPRTPLSSVLFLPTSLSFRALLGGFSSMKLPPDPLSFASIEPYAHLCPPPALCWKGLFICSLSDCEPLKGKVFCSALEMSCGGGQERPVLRACTSCTFGEDKYLHNREYTQCFSRALHVVECTRSFGPCLDTSKKPSSKEVMFLVCFVLFF